MRKQVQAPAFHHPNPLRISHLVLSDRTKTSGAGAVGGQDAILRIVEHAETVFGQDGLGDGAYLGGCPFLVSEGDHVVCAIYETRPRVCHDFRPGSERCAQVKRRT